MSDKVTARELYALFRYQLAPVGVTTMGPCAKGCGQMARGSGICHWCLVPMLQEAAPGIEWAGVADTLEDVRALLWRAEEAVEASPSRPE